MHFLNDNSLPRPHRQLNNNQSTTGDSKNCNDFTSLWVDWFTRHSETGVHIGNSNQFFLNKIINVFHDSHKYHSWHKYIIVNMSTLSHTSVNTFEHDTNTMIQTVVSMTLSAPYINTFEHDTNNDTDSSVHGCPCHYPPLPLYGVSERQQDHNDMEDEDSCLGKFYVSLKLVSLKLAPLEFPHWVVEKELLVLVLPAGHQHQQKHQMGQGLHFSRCQTKWLWLQEDCLNPQRCSWKHILVQVLGSTSPDRLWRTVSWPPLDCSLDIDGPDLLGRNWLQSLQLDWQQIHLWNEPLHEVLNRHSAVFWDELGIRVMCTHC